MGSLHLCEQALVTEGLFTWMLRTYPGGDHIPCSPLSETDALLPFFPLAGEMPKACPGLDPGAEGGSYVQDPYLLIVSRPPLCHSVTSPSARGGRGDWGVTHRLLQGGTRR